jgi:hypothetical protein
MKFLDERPEIPDTGITPVELVDRIYEQINKSKMQWQRQKYQWLILKFFGMAGDPEGPKRVDEVLKELEKLIAEDRKLELEIEAEVESEPKQLPPEPPAMER